MRCLRDKKPSPSLLLSRRVLKWWTEPDTEAQARAPEPPDEVMISTRLFQHTLSEQRESFALNSIFILTPLVFTLELHAGWRKRGGGWPSCCGTDPVKIVSGKTRVMAVISGGCVLADGACADLRSEFVLPVIMTVKKLELIKLIHIAPCCRSETPPHTASGTICSTFYRDEASFLPQPASGFRCVSCFLLPLPLSPDLTPIISYIVHAWGAAVRALDSS